MRGILAALPGQIDPRHRAHRRDHGEQQHRVGLGEPRLDAEQHRTAHDQRGKDRAAPRHERQRRPVGQQHRADRADQRRNAVEPDAHLRPRQAERGGGFDRGRLQPVDADRLLVADVVLEADVDEIAALDHLLGRLREPRLVAVDRRDVEKARQEQQQAAQQQEGDGAGMACRDKIDHAGEPAARIYPVLRLARLSKSGAGIGLGHRFRIRRNRYRDNRLGHLY